jgi:hypothetical protein
MVCTTPEKLNIIARNLRNAATACALASFWIRQQSFWFLWK